jgi:hypothetical protein
MTKKAPAAPASPDPRQVAAAQTGSNVETAIANSVIGNADETSPYGNVNYQNIGAVNVAGQNVPRYQRNVTLSPDQQNLYNQGVQLDTQLNNLAIGQANRLTGHLSNPIQAPAGSITRGNEADRRRYENALFARLEPSLEKQRIGLENRLANQGLQRGSEAFNNAIDEELRATNDARMQVITQGGNEMRAQGGFENQAYAQELQTLLALRNQPINEITALTAGSQVQMPQFPAYQGGTVAPTPVGDYYQQNANRAMSAYGSQLNYTAQQQAGLYGGIGSVLGAGLYGLGRSDRKVKRDISRIGTWLNGLPLYLFRYIDGEDFRVGFMADDVEKVRPEAVVTIGGIKHVNYDLARV